MGFRSGFVVECVEDPMDPSFAFDLRSVSRYYCGYNMSACTHPQSLLATEMSGAPLTQSHGNPLRLHMPIKYGYKQIKRIALIAYTDKRPDDYWTSSAETGTPSCSGLPLEFGSKAQAWHRSQKQHHGNTPLLARLRPPWLSPAMRSVSARCSRSPLLPRSRRSRGSMLGFPSAR